MKKYQKAGKRGLVKKAIPYDTKVVIVNNVGNGCFFYTSNKLEHSIDLNEPTSFDTIALKDLRELRLDSKNIFFEYSILIVDVLDDEYTLKDVYAFLDLMNVYDDLMLMVKSEDAFDAGCFEKFAVNSNPQVFKEVIMKLSEPAKVRLVQAFFHAYRGRAINTNSQAVYDKLTFIGRRILKVEDIVDEMSDGRAPGVDIHDLL